MPTRRSRPIAQPQIADQLRGLWWNLAAGWADRYGAFQAPAVPSLQLMDLKLLAKRCGFSRIRPEKPNIALETPMEEPAFRMLRQGLPQHLHGRLIYQSGSGIQHKVMARGLGVLAMEKQLEQLMEWLKQMAAQIPDVNGLTASEEEAEQKRQNDQVLSV